MGAGAAVLGAVRMVEEPLAPVSMLWQALSSAMTAVEARRAAYVTFRDRDAGSMAPPAARR
jgi:hypothetical protein